MAESAAKLAQSKLIILYLLNKMNMPLSNGQICRFTLEADYIEYFSLQEYLAEMTEGKLIEKIKDKNKFRYVPTKDGEQILSYFLNKIPDDVKENIDQYVAKTKGVIKRDLEISASYFYNAEHDYIAKCGIYENARPLLEINISVVSKAQAKLICKNWKTDTNNIYINVLSMLMEEPK